MITYWVRPTLENAKLLGVNSGWVNKHNMFVVNQIGREIEGVQIVSDYVKQQILDQGFIPEYKYHEKTKQFIPANSKLFEKEEDKQEKSVVKDDFKIEVGTVALVDNSNSYDLMEDCYQIVGKLVQVLTKFNDGNVPMVVVRADIKHLGKICICLREDMLVKPLSEHEKKVHDFVQDNFWSLEALTKFNVTREELAEFLISKQNNQETK